jgi:hypothetical protein
MSKISLYRSRYNQDYVFVLQVWHGHPFDNWDNCARALKLYSHWLFNIMDERELDENEVYVSEVIIEE